MKTTRTEHDVKRCQCVDCFYIRQQRAREAGRKVKSSLVEAEGQTTHTPGPWHVNRNIRRCLYVETDAPELICDMQLYDAMLADEVERCEANARLIAAAPELLAALRRIAGMAREAMQSDGDVFLSEADVLTAAEDAIKAAEGGDGDGDGR